MARRRGMVRRGQQVPGYQRLQSRARMVDDFACLVEALGWPAWRVAAERLLASRLWVMAMVAQSGQPMQMRLF